MFLVLSLSWFVAVCSAEASEEGQDKRPVMNTYFDRIPHETRYTDMTDEEDDALLDYWKQSWTEAGWEPRVLSRKDAERHPQFDEYYKQLMELRLDEFGNILFLRYLAMANEGGWMADYDVFPVIDFRQEGFALPKNGEMCVHDVVAPSLVSGKASAWLAMGNALLQDAKGHMTSQEGKLNFWTDTLGIYNLLRKEGFPLYSLRQVLGPSLIMSREPLDPEICKSRKLRKNFLGMHFSPRTMMEGSMSPELRLPRHRIEVAKTFRKEFADVCNKTATVQ